MILREWSNPRESTDPEVGPYTWSAAWWAYTNATFLAGSEDQ